MWKNLVLIREEEFPNNSCWNSARIGTDQEAWEKPDFAFEGRKHANPFNAEIKHAMYDAMLSVLVSRGL